MAVTKEQPFPQALAGIAAGFQKAESVSRTGSLSHSVLPMRNNEGDAKGA
jgi:hypothetical protein